MSFKKVGIAGSMPGTDAWSVGCFPSGEVPAGTALFIKDSSKTTSSPTIEELIGCIGVNQETNSIHGAHDIKAFADCVLKHWGNQ